MGAESLRDPWGEVLGHADLLAGLGRAARAQRLPHALLFAGPRGVGKFRAARRLANALLCAAPGALEMGPCGACGPCKRVRAGSHPDLFVIDLLELPADERPDVIPIGRFVRREGAEAWDGPTVDEFLALRAAEGGWRVVLVREMERANVSAQNSILKMLEEPGERVLWVLECSRTAELLPTIASRCMQVEFRSLSTEDTRAVLAAHGIDAARAELLARWCHGSPGEALEAASRSAPQMRGLIVDALRGVAPASIAAAAVWELEGEFDGKTPKAAERARARAALDLALDVLADFERAAAGLPRDTLAHGDLCTEPAPWLASAATARRRALDTLLQLRGDVERNVDPPLLLDRAFLSLAPPRPSVGAAAAR